MWVSVKSLKLNITMHNLTILLIDILKFKDTVNISDKDSLVNTD